MRMARQPLPKEFPPQPDRAISLARPAGDYERTGFRWRHEGYRPLVAAKRYTDSHDAAIDVRVHFSSIAFGQRQFGLLRAGESGV
jgi:hypothetical protein